MRHQNYTEYLKKEIDFLKTLVVRFHEQEQVAGIELDIALLKAQDVYEQLLRMKLMKEITKTDDEKVVFQAVANTISTNTPKHQQPVVAPELPEVEKVEDEDMELVFQKEPEQPESVFQKEPADESVLPEVLQEDNPVIPVASQNKIRKTDKIIPIENKSETDETAPSKKVQPVIVSTKKPEVKTTEILAEKIRPSGYNPINETLAQKNQTDLSRKLQSAPLQSIISGIGLNDRFLFTRELFQGNINLYNQTIQELDQADSIENAMNFINLHFDWDKEDVTTQKFIELIQRRHNKIY